MSKPTSSRSIWRETTPHPERARLQPQRADQSPWATSVDAALALLAAATGFALLVRALFA